MQEYRRALSEALEQSAYAGRKLVFGEGPAHAPVMLIGEAPGANEELEGRPFVGKAGKNLDEFLALAGLERGQLYIGNTVKIRPYRVSEAGNKVNRTPDAKEIGWFLPWLLREIELVGPAWIVTLGNTPLQALMGKGTVIGNVHGRVLEFGGRRLVPLYHPASLIYNHSLRDVYEQDVRALGEAVRACL